MTVTIEQLATCFGRPASAVLAAPPFRDWKVERSIESDLSEPRFDYVFPEAGLDLVCDSEDKVATFFLHFDDDRYFKEGLLGFLRSSTRREMLDRFGVPSESGKGFRDPLIRDFGAWDRFDMPVYSIHIEYGVDDERIRLMTLMRADRVP